MDEIENRWEYYRHSDRAAVDIGLLLLKNAVLINAGALVAILAFLGQFGESPKALGVLHSSRAFIGGLTFALVGAVAAYFYQSHVTYREGLNINKLNQVGPGPSLKVERVRIILAVIMLLLILASYGALACGAFDVYNALDQSA